MPLEHSDLPPTHEECPLRSSIGQTDLTTKNPRTSRIHEKIRGFKWSTRPDSNCRSASGWGRFWRPGPPTDLFALRSQIRPHVGMLLSPRVASTEPRARYRKSPPALLTGSFCMVHETRFELASASSPSAPPTNYSLIARSSPSRWQIIPGIAQSPVAAHFFLFLGPVLLGTDVH